MHDSGCIKLKPAGIPAGLSFLQIQLQLPELLASCCVVAGDQLLDLCRRINDVVDGLIVVDGIDDGGRELGHVCLNIPGLCFQLIGTVVQVCGHYIVEVALLVEFIEFLKAIGKESEGTADNDLIGMTVL